MYLRYSDPSWDVPETPEERSALATAQADGARLRAQRRTERRLAEANSAWARLPVVELHGVEIHAITEAGCIEYILSEMDAGRGGVVITPNLDHIRRCSGDLHFGALVSEADLVVADGMPLVWASRLQGTPLPERVAGSNLISSLSAGAAGRRRSVYLLGGSPGSAEAAAEVLKTRHPELTVAGTYCPPLGFEHNPRMMDEIQQRLAESHADVIYVALGSPKQEHLIARVRRVLPAAWWLGVGNSFSFLSGQVRRAPLWMQKSGIEWVHRLCQEPRKLFKRYLLTGIPFGVSLLCRAGLRGIPNRLWRRGSPAGWIAPASPSSEPTPVVPTGPTGGDAVSLRTAEPVAMPLTPEDSASGLSVPAAPGTPGRLSRLRALVLLGGSVRPSELSMVVNRSVLDMPLDDRGSLLNYWLSQAVDVASMAGLERLPVRVMVSQNSPEPYSAHERYFGSFRVERDQSEYRGTGGVLRDVTGDYDDDDLVLVANAAQILLEPLPKITLALERLGGDVCLVSHDDGTPSGVMLLTCKAMREVASTGFVDMKEQVLPGVAARFDVRVLPRRRPSGLPVRSREDYVQALRLHHRRRAGKPVITDPLAEEWNPAFSLVESGAAVDASARVHDSVVLAGATVEPGAVLVRCVVCPGALVRRDRTAVDQFLIAGGKEGAVPVTPTRRGAAGARVVGRLARV